MKIQQQFPGLASRTMKSGKPSPPAEPAEQLRPSRPADLMVYVRQGAARGQEVGAAAARAVGSPLSVPAGAAIGLAGAVLAGAGLTFTVGSAIWSLGHGNLLNHVAAAGPAMKGLALLGATAGAVGGWVTGGSVAGLAGGLIGKTIGSACGLVKGLAHRVTGGRPEQEQLKPDFGDDFKGRSATEKFGMTAGAIAGYFGGAAVPLMLGAYSSAPASMEMVGATAALVVVGATVVGTGGLRLAGAAERVVDRLRG